MTTQVYREKAKAIAERYEIKDPKLAQLVKMVMTSPLPHLVAMIPAESYGAVSAYIRSRRMLDAVETATRPDDWVMRYMAGEYSPLTSLE